MTHQPAAETLLARIVERDESALGELYDRLAPALLGLLLQILPDRRAAEGVLEEIFFRFWNDARRFREVQGSVAVRFVVLARAAAVERLRAGKKRPALAPYQAGTGLARANSDFLQKSLAWLPQPLEIARLEERRELLKKVMNQLPKPQRGVLELAFFEGLTEMEIAQKLGEPLARVKTGLRAAFRFLRHRLRAVIGTWAANI